MVEYVDLYFPPILLEQPQELWTHKFAPVQLHLQLVLKLTQLLMQEVLQLLDFTEVYVPSIYYAKALGCVKTYTDVPKVFRLFL